MRYQLSDMSLCSIKNTPQMNKKKNRIINLNYLYHCLYVFYKDNYGSKIGVENWVDPLFAVKKCRAD